MLIIQVQFSNYQKDTIRKWALRSGLNYSIFNQYPNHIIQFYLDDNDNLSFLRILYYLRKKKDVQVTKLKPVDPEKVLSNFYVWTRPFRAYSRKDFHIISSPDDIVETSRSWGHSVDQGKEASKVDILKGPQLSDNSEIQVRRGN